MGWVLRFGATCYYWLMDDCIFCQIVEGKLPSEKILETNLIMALRDTHPKAPVHALIVPKLHRTLPEELTADEAHALLTASEEVAQILDIKEAGYRLAFNVGHNSGQEINHVHLHVLGGRVSQALF